MNENTDLPSPNTNNVLYFFFYEGNTELSTELQVNWQNKTLLYSPDASHAFKYCGNIVVNSIQLLQ